MGSYRLLGIEARDVKGIDSFRAGEVMKKVVPKWKQGHVPHCVDGDLDAP